MRRLEHAPWCHRHCEDVICCTDEHEFGPLEPAWPDSEPAPIAGMVAERSGDHPVRVFIECRSQTGGLMDVGALRSVREAVAESPDEFLMALDKLIATLGSDVPPAHTCQPQPA